MFQKGVSGNPRGQLSIAVVYGQLLAEFEGRELSAAHHVLLEHSARLLCKAARTGNPDAAAKLTNVSMRLAERVRKAAKPQRSKLSTKERIAAALAVTS